MAEGKQEMRPCRVRCSDGDQYYFPLAFDARESESGSLIIVAEDGGQIGLFSKGSWLACVPLTEPKDG